MKRGTTPILIILTMLTLLAMMAASSPLLAVEPLGASKQSLDFDKSLGYTDDPGLSAPVMGGKATQERRQRLELYLERSQRGYDDRLEDLYELQMAEISITSGEGL